MFPLLLVLVVLLLYSLGGVVDGDVIIVGFAVVVDDVDAVHVVVDDDIVVVHCVGDIMIVVCTSCVVVVVVVYVGCSDVVGGIVYHIIDCVVSCLVGGDVVVGVCVFCLCLSRA